LKRDAHGSSFLNYLYDYQADFEACESEFPGPVNFPVMKF
jgi:hypothetical protein